MSVGSYHKQRAREGTIHVQVSDADRQRFREFAALAPKAMAAAQRRAINKTLGWLRTHIARAVGQEERIAVRAVRERLRVRQAKGIAGRGELWFGINPLPASLTGKPRQAAQGVSVGRRRYPGAFYQRVYGDRPDIWIRTASKQFDAKDYPDRGAGRGNLDASLSGRFPVAKAKISLEGARRHFDRWVAQAEARLLELLRQEVNYEIHKLLGNSNGRNRTA
ncbi:hypothetical protein HA520_10450 [Azotobacter chroococcum]|uniref:Uncharacterized protein n=1 Tax=Azotobacter chroococcum TaxID=353 RepID=A0AA43Z695_9GAMM|nr:hypothetical protein [Azotobacter chroococcum]NHN77699.1 hypothetical protein [Azotobacter chroococcum]